MREKDNWRRDAIGLCQEMMKITKPGPKARIMALIRGLGTWVFPIFRRSPAARRQQNSTWTEVTFDISLHVLHYPQEYHSVPLVEPQSSQTSKAITNIYLCCALGLIDDITTNLSDREWPRAELVIIPKMMEPSWKFEGHPFRILGTIRPPSH
jgi:hypothetical protein